MWLLIWWQFELALFLVGLVVFGIIVLRAGGWKVWLMVILLALYGVAIFLVLVANEFCGTPLNNATATEMNATRLLLVLAVVCLINAAIQVRHRKYAYALICLAVPPLLSIPIMAIVHLLVPGERACAPF